jgi:hypothetical protein
VRKNATVLTMRTHTEAIARSRLQSFSFVCGHSTKTAIKP